MEKIYASLEVETRIVVQQRTSEIKTLMRRSAQDIIEIGLKLIEVNLRLGHGLFYTWLHAEFEWSESTAVKFMQVAERFKSVNITDLHIAPSALYLLAAPSTPESVRDEALARAGQGELITHAKAREIVQLHRSTPAAPKHRTERTSLETERDGSLTFTEPFTPNSEPQEVIASPPMRPTVATNSTSVSASAVNTPISETPGYDSDEWYTPAEYIDAARSVMGNIDLDPATCNVA